MDSDIETYLSQRCARSKEHLREFHQQMTLKYGDAALFNKLIHPTDGRSADPQAIGALRAEMYKLNGRATQYFRAVCAANARRATDRSSSPLDAAAGHQDPEAAGRMSCWDVFVRFNRVRSQSF